MGTFSVSVQQIGNFVFGRMGISSEKDREGERERGRMGVRVNAKSFKHDALFAKSFIRHFKRDFNKRIFFCVYHVKAIDDTYLRRVQSNTYE